MASALRNANLKMEEEMIKRDRDMVAQEAEKQKKRRDATIQMQIANRDRGKIGEKTMIAGYQGSKTAMSKPMEKTGDINKIGSLVYGQVKAADINYYDNFDKNQNQFK